MEDNTARILKEGVIGGLAAYVSAVLVLALLHVIQGESIFHSAAAMGSVLFYGEQASEQFAVAAAPVLAYNGVHLVGSLVVGLVAAFFVFETESHHAFWYFTFTAVIAAVVYSITIFGVFGVEIGGVLEWSTVLVGTAAWTLALVAYFWWAHRGLMKEIQEELKQDAS